MIRQLLVNRYTKPVLRSIYLRAPTFLSATLYSILRSSGDPRRRYFEKAFETVAASGTEGDYLEFGVYQGSSFIMAFQLARRYRLNTMRFFAFDSFEGLPASEGAAFRKGDYMCSRESFTRIVKKGGVELERVGIVEGFYSHSLTDTVKQDHNLRKVAIVNVDCDLYSSTKEVLRFVEDLIQPGSIIIFDDWYAFEDTSHSSETHLYGERRAFQEWPGSNWFEELYDSINGKAFLMRHHP